MRIVLPEWLMTHKFIIGYEEPGGTSTGTPAGGDPSGGQGSGDGAGDSDKSGDKGEGEGGDSGDGKEPEDLTGLKNALAAERRLNKQREKELRAASTRLKEIDDKDKSEVERLQAASESSTKKLERLAAGFKESSLNAAITNAARDLKFKDPSDALTGIDKSAIEVEQDDDDPSKVIIDLKAVKAAVKALADKKKYLVGDDGDGEASGSSFGGSRKDKKQADEETLKGRYPSLR